MNGRRPGEALRALVRDTGFTAYLSVRVGDEAMCIHWEQGQGINVLVLRPGRTLPFYAGAAGRCFLSTLEEEQLTDYLGRTQPVPFTDHTLVDADALRRDAERTRQRGYALSIEDVTVGAGAIGMLIQDDTRTSLGCVSLAGVASHISVQQEGLAAQLREALGCRRPPLTPCEIISRTVDTVSVQRKCCAYRGLAGRSPVPMSHQGGDP